MSAKLPAGWYDGEIVLLDQEDKPNFNALQNAIDGGKNEAIVFYLFDAHRSAAAAICVGSRWNSVAPLCSPC